MSTDPDHQEDVLAELEKLEASARARRKRNARMLRAGAVVVAATFLFFMRAELRYALQPKAAADLGGPLEYNLQLEGSPRYVKIDGVPGGQAATVSHMGKQLRVFGLLGSNVVVVQDLGETTPEEAPTRGAPFKVSGKLVRDDDAVELHNVFNILEASGVVARIDGHLYALWAGEVPRQGWALPLELLAIAVFLLINFRAAHRMERPLPGFTDDDSPPGEP